MSIIHPVNMLSYNLCPKTTMLFTEVFPVEFHVLKTNSKTIFSIINYLPYHVPSLHPLPFQANIFLLLKWPLF